MTVVERVSGTKIAVLGGKLRLSTPFSLVHGHQHSTGGLPGELAEEYYNSLEAPVKGFTWFENSAHDVYHDEPDEFNQEMIRIANEILAEPAE
jgi:pimeloyl-ACP methyl ester carboxylesterase